MAGMGSVRGPITHVPLKLAELLFSRIPQQELSEIAVHTTWRFSRICALISYSRRSEITVQRG